MKLILNSADQTERVVIETTNLDHTEGVDPAGSKWSICSTGACEHDRTSEAWHDETNSETAYR